MSAYKTTSALIAALLVSACGADGPPEGEGACAGTPQYWVITSLSFNSAEDGVAPGFDFDGVVSDGSEPETCYQPDLTAPDGTPGIDNQIAVVVAGVEDAIGDVFGATTQSSINDGQLLLLLSMGGADSLAGDDCVSFSMERGTGLPLLGTDGRVEAFQTFGIDLAAGRADTPATELVDGQALAGPFLFSLALDIQSVPFDLTFYDAQIQVQIDEDGNASGDFGGALRIAEVAEALARNPDDSFTSLAVGILETTADLAPDERGVCQDLSASLSFTAVPAFAFRE